MTLGEEQKQPPSEREQVLSLVRFLGLILACVIAASLTVIVLMTALS